MSRIDSLEGRVSDLERTVATLERELGPLAPGRRLGFADSVALEGLKGGLHEGPYGYGVQDR